jgi:hypothetical protein
VATTQSERSKPAIDHKAKLNETETLHATIACLQPYLGLTADGYCCQTADLYQVLVGIAAQAGTLESVAQELAGAPDPQTLRNYLNAQLTVERLDELEAAVNRALRQSVPKWLRRSRQEVAFDLHDRPYYGKAPQATALWVGCEAKHGTTRCYRVATAYVIARGVRVTLAIRFVRPADETVEIVKLLRQRVRACGLQISVLYLDKGFAGVAVLRYLDQARQPALIACAIRGRTGGTHALCRGRKSYRTRYTFQGQSADYTAELAVCRVKNKARGKPKMSWLIFIMIRLDWSPERARAQYRSRFGIETSYRCAKQVGGWTTSPNPAYRFVLLALGFLLTNCWQVLRYLHTQVARRGRRRLDTARFKLTRFVRFLLRALERIYGVIHEIEAPVTPRL